MRYRIFYKNINTSNRMENKSKTRVYFGLIKRIGLFQRKEAMPWQVNFNLSRSCTVRRWRS